MTTPPPSSPYPEGSQATTALILGILGLVTCPALGPVAWWLGQQEVSAIDEGRRPPENRGNANAGKILGMIGSALLAVGVILIVLFVLIGGLAVVRS